jgi:TonB-linked SusC/RagA family outer membrane protein
MLKTAYQWWFAPAGNCRKTKTLLVMKLTMLLLIAGIFTLQAEGLSQNVTLSGRNIPMEKVFSAVQKQTGFVFFYKDNTLADIRPVTIKVHNKPVIEFLTELFLNQPLQFSIENKTIFVSRGLVRKDIAVENPFHKPQPLPLPINISGRVADTTGNPIEGVSVMLGGTSRGTTTDAMGEFMLLDIPEKATLIFSYIGFNTERVAVGGRSRVELVMHENNTGLNQVVVVGYGTERRKDLTGAISTVSGDEIATRKTVQLSDALQGAIAGVTVTRSSSTPGASSAIRFRGITTIGNNAPLIIVDGVPVANIDNINPNDIESITALKDAASTSVYGSRAAAGVLLITMKKGKTGQATLDYNYEYGSQRPTQLPEYVGSTRYMQLYNEYLTNDGGAAFYANDFINNYIENNAKDPDKYPITNWQEAILKSSAPREMHNLAFTIGTSKVKTRASLGYSNTRGLYENLSFQRYTVQINNDIQLNKIISASVDVSALHSSNFQTVVTDGDNPFSIARLLPPPLFDDLYEDGRLAPGKEGLNPLAQIKEGGYNKTYDNQLRGRLVVAIKPMKQLTITALVAPTYTFTRNKIFSKRIGYTDLNDPSKIIFYNKANTTLDESRPYSYVFNGQLLANYNTTIREDHSLEALAGYEDNYNYDEYMRASRGSFVLTNFPYLDNGSTALRNNSGGASETALRSFFGRAKYNYKSKYYLQANLRYDGSSRFNPANRWAAFPSFSAGWAISEENFFENVKSVTLLKLRGSWGQTGNERIGNYPYQASFTFGNSLFYNNGLVTPETSGAQVAYAVSNITWETQETSDIGIDASLFNNKLSFSGDIYYKQTRNILLALDIPVSLGFEKPFQNAGKVSSRGWEIATRWTDKLGGLRYSIGFNLSDARTRIDDMKGSEQLGAQANIQGGEFGSWYGYRSAGLYQTAEEVASSPSLNINTKAGDIRYMDIDGDNKVTPDKDQVLLGGSLPRYMYGLISNFEYRNFTLSLVIQGVGKQLSRLSYLQIEPFVSGYGNVPQHLDGNYWSQANTKEQNLNARYPRFSRLSHANNYLMSDYWLINGAYLRIKNLTLSYKVPSSVIKRFRLQGLNLYIAANDVFTRSKFPTGWDPEVGSSTTYPIVTTVLAGVNLNF